MYLSYEKYVEMGGAIGAVLYPRFEMKARKLIDRMTHCRLQDEEPVRESVEYCMYELIEMIYADETSGSGGREIAGISNDGVSISFATGQSSAGNPEARYMNYIRTWLDGEVTTGGVALLYAGVDA